MPPKKKKDPTILPNFSSSELTADIMNFLLDSSDDDSDHSEDSFDTMDDYVVSSVADSEWYVNFLYCHDSDLYSKYNGFVHKITFQIKIHDILVKL